MAPPSERLVSALELLRIYADAFVKRAIHLDTSIDALNNKSIWDDNEHRAVLVMELRELQQICKDGELPVTQVLVDYLLKTFDMVDAPKTPDAVKDSLRRNNTAELLKHQLFTLRDRFQDELSTKLFFQLPHSSKVMFENARQGWESAIERFPETVIDIEESAKCFALSRYAASVFHAIQVIEHGLLKLGEFISVKDPISGWTAVANELKRITTKRHAERTDFEKQHFLFIEQMQGTVEALKNAWRNKISHAQGRLVLMSGDFSPEIAEEIRTAARSFMRRLATDLPK